MERPLPIRSPRLTDLLGLARELMYAAPTSDSHVAALAACFARPVSPRSLQKLAARTLAWTAARPLLRARALADRLRTVDLFRRLCDKHGFVPPSPLHPPEMRHFPGTELLPSLPTLAELASWLRLDPALQAWMADLQDRNGHAVRSALRHYTVRLQPKPEGGVRVVEAPKPLLRSVQRQILHCLLDLVPLHDAVHGFRKGRSIVSFAQPHAGKAAVLRMDLQDFFPGISGARVQTLFRTLGYPEAVADVLGGLCTVTTPKSCWNGFETTLSREARLDLERFYARPHLPQGAPTSPSVANLCAFRLDRRLAGLAQAAEATYTRYADDLAFSGGPAFARSIARFGAHVAAIALEEGFHVNHRKTRQMRTGSRQRLAGLTVNRQPNLPRQEMERLEAILFNSVRHGPETQNRAALPDFRRHLEGRVAFATMVHPDRAAPLRELLERIRWDG